MNLFHTHVSEESIQLAADVLRSGFLNQGPMVDRFEQELATQLGWLNPVTVNSCTTAIHLALVLEGVGAGDEVILPPQTFIATGLAVLMTGAKPVFADIDENGNVLAASVRKKITGKTKAVIAVHWGGTPCEIEDVVNEAYAYNLPVIEDAAHALGAWFMGMPVGSGHSDYACFSFQSIKTLTCGDGGALCVANTYKAQEARRRRWFGIDKKEMKRTELGDRDYDVTELGFKYHMNDLAAAVGLGNLHSLPSRLSLRTLNASYYRDKLGRVPGLRLPNVPAHVAPAWWLFTVKVHDRNNFVRAMTSRGVPCSVVDRRIDKNSVFGGPTPDLPGVEYFDAHQVSLPVHEGLTDDEVRKVADAVLKGW